MHTHVLLHKELLASSLLNHSTGLKVKPIICKPHKEKERSISTNVAND
jgi:hypothetical protein